jgi:hypothetical protein
MGSSGAAPGKGTQIEQTYGTGMDYVDQGAMCERPTVGVCNLESSQRGRLMQMYQYNVGQAAGAFKSGASMARTDILLEPDSEMSWILELALDAGGLAIAKSLGKAVSAFGEWAKGAQSDAYDRLFAGEFVSERRLKMYGAAAQVPLGPLEGAADIAVAQGKTGLSKALAGGGFGNKKAAQEVFLRELAKQAAHSFNYLVTTVAAHLDDAALLLMTEAFNPASFTEFDYKDAIDEKINQFSSMKLDKIGHGTERDVGNTAGHTVERGAVYVVKGNEQRMALIEVDGPVHTFTKGDALREIYPQRSKFVEWITDPTMQHAAEQLTRQRGNGNIGTVTAEAAGDKLEGFWW